MKNIGLSEVGFEKGEFNDVCTGKYSKTLPYFFRLEPRQGISIY